MIITSERGTPRKKGAPQDHIETTAQPTKAPPFVQIIRDDLTAKKMAIEYGIYGQLANHRPTVTPSIIVAIATATTAVLLFSGFEMAVDNGWLAVVATTAEGLRMALAGLPGTVVTVEKLQEGGEPCR